MFFVLFTKRPSKMPMLLDMLLLSKHVTSANCNIRKHEYNVEILLINTSACKHNLFSLNGNLSCNILTVFSFDIS